MLPPEASASAAVAALFFAAGAASVPNFVLTGRGFRLYIPLGIAAVFRGVAHAARAAFFTTRSPDAMAAYGALNAAGFGITVAMCCCFAAVWLRNAAHGQPPPLVRLLRRACAALVAAVIAFGPLLGVVGAGVVYGARPGDLAALEHGAHIRAASASGFLAVCGVALLIAAYLAATWAAAQRGVAAAHAAQQQQHQGAAAALGPAAAATHEQQPKQQQGAAATHDHQQDQQEHEEEAPRGGRWRDDGLIFVLLSALALLTWAAAMRLAAVEHPQLIARAALYYPASVLPELIVAWLWALPALAARVALGRRYSPWLRQQQQQQQRGGRGGQQQRQRGAAAEEGVDAQASITAGGSTGAGGDKLQQRGGA